MLEAVEIFANQSIANHIALGVEFHIVDGNTLKGNKIPMVHIGKGGMIDSDGGIATGSAVVEIETKIHIAIAVGQKVSDVFVVLDKSRSDRVP